MLRRTTLISAGIVALVISGFILVRDRSEEPPQDDPVAASVGSETKSERVPVQVEGGGDASPERTAVAGLPAPQLSPHPVDSEEYEQWVGERTRSLLGLAWNEDRESMLAILAELRNPDSEIRDVAIEATREFSSRDAIPVLRAMIAGDATPDEQRACKELIEWLELPTLSEKLMESKARSGAAPPAKGPEVVED